MEANENFFAYISACSFSYYSVASIKCAKQVFFGGANERSLSFQESVETCSVEGTCSVVLTFESVYEILWCDHLNETFSAVLFAWYSLFFNTL